MRKEILIRVPPNYDNGHHSKALKVAASINGIASVTLTGRDRDLLLVIGDGVDEAKLASKLNKVVGGAEIVELRSLPPGGADPLPPVASMDMVAALSPYHRHHSTPGRSLPLPGGSELVSGQAGEGYHYCYPPGTPSPGHYHYHLSPALAGPAGQGPQLGYGGGYGYAGSSGSATRAVARSHPASYSPMTARQDRRVGGWGRRSGGRRLKPNCCTMM